MTSSRRMVVAQPANHGEGRSAEGAEGRTGDRRGHRERRGDKEVGGKGGKGAAETGRPLLVLFIRDTPHAADTRILLF